MFSFISVVKKADCFAPVKRLTGKTMQPHLLAYLITTAAVCLFVVRPR